MIKIRWAKGLYKTNITKYHLREMHDKDRPNTASCNRRVLLDPEDTPRETIDREVVCNTCYHHAHLVELITECQLECIREEVIKMRDEMFSSSKPPPKDGGMFKRWKDLPFEQLKEITFTEDNAHRLIIGGMVEKVWNVFFFQTGTLDIHAIWLSDIRPSGTTTPDFKKLSFDDYGQTVCFGKYEASSESIIRDRIPITKL